MAWNHIGPTHVHARIVLNICYLGGPGLDLFLVLVILPRDDRGWDVIHNFWWPVVQVSKVVVALIFKVLDDVGGHVVRKIDHRRDTAFNHLFAKRVLWILNNCVGDASHPVA